MALPFGVDTKADWIGLLWSEMAVHEHRTARGDHKILSLIEHGALPELDIAHVPYPMGATVSDLKEAETVSNRQSELK